MPRRNRETKLIFAVLAVFFVAFLAVPMIQVLMKSVMTDSGAGMTLANYVEVLTGKDFLKGAGKQLCDFHMQCGADNNPGIYPGIHGALHQYGKVIKD